MANSAVQLDAVLIIDHIDRFCRPLSAKREWTSSFLKATFYDTDIDSDTDMHPISSRARMSVSVSWNAALTTQSISWAIQCQPARIQNPSCTYLNC